MRTACAPWTILLQELFAALIGVLSHSEAGAGTVVGSEVFNLLVSDPPR